MQFPLPLRRRLMAPHMGLHVRCKRQHQQGEMVLARALCEMANTSREDLLGLVLRTIVMVINNTNTVPVVPQQAPKGELGLFMSLVYGTVLHYTGCTVRDKGASTVRCACGASTVALCSTLMFMAIITIQIVLYHNVHVCLGLGKHSI
jgi:hypothetical protein